MKNTAVLVGKGPSAREVYKSDEYDICAVNNAVILCEEVDLLFVNDMEALDLISENEWKKVKKVVIPTYPHKDWNAQRHITFQSFLDEVPVDVNYHVHRLDTCFDKNPKVDYLGPSYSVGTVGIQYLCKYGYKKVYHCGIDAQGGYHPMFMKKNEQGEPINHQCRPEPHGTYLRNWSIFVNTAKANNVQLVQF